MQMANGKQCSFSVAYSSFRDLAVMAGRELTMTVGGSCRATTMWQAGMLCWGSPVRANGLFLEEDEDILCAMLFFVSSMVSESSSRSTTWSTSRTWCATWRCWWCSWRSSGCWRGLRLKMHAAQPSSCWCRGRSHFLVVYIHGVSRAGAWARCEVASFLVVYTGGYRDEAW